MLKLVDDGILGILFLSDSPNGLFNQQSLKMCIRERVRLVKVEEVISRVAELCRQHDAQKVILYGSRAKGTASVSYTHLDVYKRQILIYKLVKLLDILSLT